MANQKRPRVRAIKGTLICTCAQKSIVFMKNTIITHVYNPINHKRLYREIKSDSETNMDNINPIIPISAINSSL